MIVGRSEHDAAPDRRSPTGGLAVENRAGHGELDGSSNPASGAR